MEEMKDKMKGFVKKVTPSSSSKFTGQGRVLGSSSSSSSSPASSVVNSRLLNPPTNPNPNPNPKPKPPPRTPTPPSDPDSPAAESVRRFLSADPREEAVDIALRLLRNVAREPGSEKFRRIRMGNPKIREAVGDAEGWVGVLESVGFRFGEEEGEVWATMGLPTEEMVVGIKEAVAVLERWKEKDSKGGGGGADASVATKPDTAVETKPNAAVETKPVDRQIRVFFSVSESVAANIDLPDNFYNLSSEEIRREAQSRKKKMEESQLLVPKSYKEKQANAARKKYKFTVIRVQFPDGVVLQGIFRPSEPTTSLYEFVSSSLKEPGLEFELLSPAAPKLRVIPRFPIAGDKRTSTLEEERLVPSALIKFKPIETDSVVFTGLTNELLEISEPLTSNTTVL